MQTRGLADSVLESAEQADLAFAQFKSCPSVDLAFEGKADFDLLVDPESINEWSAMLSSFGFLERVQSQPWRHEGVRDFIALDPAAGNLIHFSLHGRLILGAAPVKSRSWPVMDWMIRPTNPRKSTRGVPCVTAETEAAIGLLRIGLKTRLRLKTLAHPRSSPLGHDAGLIEEVSGILEMCDPSAVVSALDELTRGRGRFIFEHGRDVTGPEMNLRKLIRYSVQVRRTTSFARVRSSMASVWLAGRSTLGRNIRSVSAEGAVVACVGIDGGGKSTLSRVMAEDLGKKITVRTVYLGRAPGRAGGMAIRGLSQAGKIFHALSLQRASEIMDFLRNAGYRRLTAARAAHARGRGEIVITDRYPLRAWWSAPQPMDGPRLDRDSRLASLERGMYEQIPEPDLTLWLSVAPEVAAQRRGIVGKELQRLSLKHRQVSSLNGVEDKVVRIDANGPAQGVLLQAKLALWHLLTSGDRVDTGS